jgi:hypothetical protein
MKRTLTPLFLALSLALAGCGAKTATLAESGETVRNWSLARQYQAAGRYEMARQHYSLALSAVRTQSALEMLKRELAAVDLQIRALR